MKTVQLAALSLGVLVLAGCSSMSVEEKRVDYKSATSRMPSLEIPPDLTRPGVADQYAIPEVGETVASYSDFARSGAPSQAGAGTVLPQAKNVRLERSGTHRWLVVNEKAENVWPQIKAFWQENGFAIKTENMQAGIIETGWAENRAKIPQGGLRSVIGKVMDNLYSSGEQDMYRTRMERSKNDAGTEIYISHYGKEEVLSADKSISKWQSRPNDPELEATMLQMLMARLGGAAQKDAPVEQASAWVAPKWQTLANGSKTIILDESFDKSWRKVGLALERASLVVDDKDRANGIYFLRVTEAARDKGVLDRLAFWRSEDGKAVRYQVNVREGNAGVEVSVTTSDGVVGPETQRITEELFRQLGQK